MRRPGVDLCGIGDGRIGFVTRDPIASGTLWSGWPSWFAHLRLPVAA